jgi:hypothetical protein
MDDIWRDVRSNLPKTADSPRDIDETPARVDWMQTEAHFRSRNLAVRNPEADRAVR